jgi:transposase
MKYNELNAKLTGRNASRRKLENNTYVERREDGSITIRLHETDILTFLPDVRKYMLRRLGMVS